MCKLGDIIVINKYVGDDHKEISKHSFVVINDKSGFIEGFKSDMIVNVMSSFKEVIETGSLFIDKTNFIRDDNGGIRRYE